MRLTHRELSELLHAYAKARIDVLIAESEHQRVVLMGHAVSLHNTIVHLCFAEPKEEPNGTDSNSA